MRLSALWVMLAILTAQACALPINMGFAFLQGNEKPISEGCERKTCCTALCYVDKHGVHHCVHEGDNDSVCGVSKNELIKNPVLPLPNAVLLHTAFVAPDFIPNGSIPPALDPVQTCDVTVPSPPPK